MKKLAKGIFAVAWVYVTIFYIIPWSRDNIGPLLNNLYQGSYSSQELQNEYAIAIKEFDLKNSKLYTVEELYDLSGKMQIEKDEINRRWKNSYIPVVGKVEEIKKLTADSLIDGAVKYKAGISTQNFPYGLKASFLLCSFYTFNDEQADVLRKIGKDDNLILLVKGLHLWERGEGRQGYDYENEGCVPYVSINQKIKKLNNIMEKYIR